MEKLAWYHSAVSRAVRRARRCRRFLAYVIATQVFTMIVYIQFFVYSVRYRQGFFFFVTLIMAIIWFRVIWKILTSYQLAWLKRVGLITTGAMYRVPADALTEVRQLVATFTARLAPPDMQHPELELWLSRSSGLSPSVFELHGRTCLNLPLGFVSLLRRDPTQARTLLAHEVAHIVQRDAKLWRLANLVGLRLYDALSRLNLHLIWVGLAIAIYITINPRTILDPVYEDAQIEIAQIDGYLAVAHAKAHIKFPDEYAQAAIDQVRYAAWFNLVGGVVGTLIIYGLLRYNARLVAASRHASECLADIGAALCVGDREYNWAVSSLMPNTYVTPMHPSSEERLRMVATLFASEHTTKPLVVCGLPL